MSVIFIAIPSKGTVEDNKLTPKFMQFLMKLHLDNPEHVFISPMIQDYELAKYLPTEMEMSWNEWGWKRGKACEILIERSDEIWVLKFDGWDTSVGVSEEVKHAQLHNKCVKYVDVLE